MRAFFALVTLAIVGVTVFVHFEAIYLLVMPAVYYFGRRFLVGFFYVFVIRPLLSDRVRRAFEKLRLRLTMKFFILWMLCKRWWRQFGWPLRMLVAVCVALGAGISIILFVLLRIPLTRIPFFQDLVTWLEKRAFPLLLRTAAFQSVASRLPSAWLGLPEKVRTKVERLYKWVWWRTARWLVKKRITFGQRHREKKYLRRFERQIEADMYDEPRS